MRAAVILLALAGRAAADASAEADERADACRR